MHKIVLITGASSGIGKSIGEFLHSRSFKVYGTSRTPAKYTDSVFPLLELDVRDSSGIQKVVGEVIRLAGHVDVLINNAGVGITGPLEETPIEEIRNNFETNLFGPIQMMQAVLPYMRSRKSGLIINITSIAGYMGLPYRGVYSASKGALSVVTEAIRMEVKQFGVEITDVAPGDFATNIAAGRYHAPVVSGSAYEKVYGKCLTEINEHVGSGSDPTQMAEAIFAIIRAERPKVHYKIGAAMQRFSVVLKKILPDKSYEKMLMKHYKL